MTADLSAPPLAGQVAIVTGGGRGIGRAIATALAAEGASVAVAARTEDQVRETVREIEAAGGRAVAVPADVTDPASVAGLVEAAERLGPIDLVVNNAGSFAGVGPVWEMDPDLWWRDVETNLRGTFLVCRAVLPAMVAGRRGRLINLAGGGAAAPMKGASGYGSSKAAVVRLTETLAAETLDLGVKVFAMSPGLVRTAMPLSALATPAGQHYFPGIARAFEEGRHSPPERAGHLAAFLATPAADFLHGRLVSVNDDLEDLVSRAGAIQQEDLYTLRLRK